MHLISTYLSIILIYILIGLVIYVFPTFVVSRPLMRKGYIGWGFLAGLLTLIICFLLSNYLLEFGNYQAFSKNGPCGTCYEWGFIPFLMLWTGSGIGAGLFIIHNLIAGVRLYKRGVLSIMRWPSPLGYWFLGIIFITLIVLVIQYFWPIQQRVQVLEKISNADSQITGKAQLVEIGKYPLALPLLLPITSMFGQDTLMQFSPDGKWLFLKLDTRLEVWNATTLSREFEIDELNFYSGIFAVSPDSSLIVVQKRPNLAVYELETGELIWEISTQIGYPFGMRFTTDGSQIVLLDSHKIIRLDAKTGQLAVETDISYDKDAVYFVVNHDGSYFAGIYKNTVYIFDGYTGELLHSVAVRQGSQEKISGQMTFLPNNELLLWSDKPYEYWFYIWNVNGELIQATQMDINSPQNYAFNPTSDLFFYVSRYGDKHYLMNLMGIDVQEINLDSAITAATFSPNNHLLVIATADGYLRFYAQLPTGK